MRLDEHWTDEHGNPAGGVTSGCGFAISWQNGPLGRGDERKRPNGAFVEDVLGGVIERLRFYQEGEFACQENAEAIEHLKHAVNVLGARTRDREGRKVEGTHTV